MIERRRPKTAELRRPRRRRQLEDRETRVVRLRVGSGVV